MLTITSTAAPKFSAPSEPIAPAAKSASRTVVPTAHAVPDIFVIGGSAEFSAAVRCDLEFLASTRAGARLFELLGREVSRHKLAGRQGVLEIGPGEANQATHNGPLGEDATLPYRRLAFEPPNVGASGAYITYNSSQRRLSDGTERPPAVGLHHELCHALDFIGGTTPSGRSPESGVLNVELKATGEPFDHDRDPATPDVAYSHYPTENDLRSELGLPERQYPRRPGFGLAQWPVPLEDATRTRR